VLKNRVPQEIEDAIIALAVEQPAFGQVRIANELRTRGLAQSHLPACALFVISFVISFVVSKETGSHDGVDRNAPSHNVNPINNNRNSTLVTVERLI
jgi:hypothetical protein